MEAATRVRLIELAWALVAYVFVAAIIHSAIDAYAKGETWWAAFLAASALFLSHGGRS